MEKRANEKRKEKRKREQVRKRKISCLAEKPTCF